jgi:hypothetical protein
LLLSYTVLTVVLPPYYRGTASKRQMEANLKYKQRAIVFSDLTTSTLDHLDGLTIKHGTRRVLYLPYP